MRNFVIGVDLDLIAEHANVRAYAEMWRRNGAVRVVKTAGRHALGLHRRYTNELDRRLDHRTADGAQSEAQILKEIAHATNTDEEARGY